jgi:hypothetical protein
MFGSLQIHTFLASVGREGFRMLRIPFDGDSWQKIARALSMLLFWIGLLETRCGDRRNRKARIIGGNSPVSCLIAIMFAS